MPGGNKKVTHTYMLSARGSTLKWRSAYYNDSPALHENTFTNNTGR